MEIQDRVAVVTGAASGIGRAVCAELAKRGCKAIAMVDASDAVCGVAEEASRGGERTAFQPFTGNVTDGAFRAEVYDRMGADHGVVSICVPAAGITRDALAVRVDKQTGKAQVYSPELFQLVTDVDLIAPVYWGLEMVARIAEDRHARSTGRWQPEEGITGTIVFIGSVSSLGNKGQIAYATAKAGLVGAAATIMKEAMFYGVRTAVVHPGYTDTPMVAAVGEERIAKSVLPYTQLGRLIRPAEIADAICFVIGNSVVSGQLWADAGWHPGPA